MALPKDIHSFDLNALNFEKKIKIKPDKKPQFSVIYGKGGIGKAQPLDAKVLTPDGWKIMMDINPGDFVVDENGKKAKVINTFTNDNLEMYEVEFSDRSKTRCCIDHLWDVQSKHQKFDGTSSVKTLREIINDGIALKRKNAGYRYSVRLVKPIEFKEKHQLIDAWEFGYIIGNGTSKKTSILSVTIGHQDKNDITLKFDKDSIISITDKSSNVRQLSLNKKIRKYYENELNLGSVKSINKWIPENYLFGSIEQRKKLLAGLVDSDGSCINNKATFSTSSKRLSDDFVNLVRSLGGVARVVMYDRSDKLNVEYVVKFRVPFNPFSLKRKMDEYVVRNNDINGSKRIINTSYIGYMTGKCLFVDTERHLYITDDFTVTHNTTIASYSPEPIIIPVGRETGAEKMCVPKFPNYDEMGLTITDHVFACLSWLIKNEHTRKTLIIDNAGAYREGVDGDVEDSNKGVDLKAFGKAQSLAYPYWTTLLAGIDSLMKKRDMNVILIGHDSAYNVNLPDGNYYQRISINTPRGENTNVTGLIEARCHNMFYMTNESATSKVKDKFGQAKIIATGGITRTIYTKPSGQFFAKSRVNLEEYYDIGNTDTEEDLLHHRTNEDILNFWDAVYK